jgi:hypothetical protein
MTPTEHIYVVRPSSDETRPFIDFQIPENGRQIDWLRIANVLRGDRSLDEYESVSLVVDHPEATNWDFYSCGGTMGLLSERAARSLGPHASICFDLVEASVNEAPFFFLRVREFLDCLDRARSDVVLYPSDPAAIMKFKRYAFFKDRIPDPALFMIPEGLFGPFGTDAVVHLIRAERLRGFDIIDAEA